MPNSEPPEPPGESPAEDPAGRSESATWDRVHALFHAALELDAEGRIGFLARLAEEEPAIAKEVGSLLAAHEDASGFLAESPAASFARAIVPGDKLGAYRIVEEIGRGGMGVVYRAVRDDQSFTKEVAVK